jgi:hypothetical protein
MFHFACNACDFRVDVDYLPRVYVLPDGRQLGMMQRHIWCESCTTIAVAEGLTEDPDNRAWRTERRDEHRRSLETGVFVSAFTNEMAQKIMPDLCRKWIEESEETDRLMAKWQSLRTAGQRCLRCGNADISFPEKDWIDLPHTPCKGILQCSATIQAGTFTDRRIPHQYDVDGHLIRRGKMSDAPDADDLPLWWPGT